MESRNKKQMDNWTDISAIAAHYFGCELVAAELDTEYYEASKKRFKLITSQQKLF